VFPVNYTNPQIPPISTEQNHTKVTENTPPRTHHKHSQILHSSETEILRRRLRVAALNRTREQTKAKSLADAHFRGRSARESRYSELSRVRTSRVNYSVHPTIPARAEGSRTHRRDGSGRSSAGNGRSDTATSSSGGRASRRLRSDGGRPRRTPPSGGAIRLSFSG
jgi:hypothetical protein